MAIISQITVCLPMFARRCQVWVGLSMCTVTLDWWLYLPKCGRQFLFRQALFRQALSRHFKGLLM